MLTEDTFQAIDEPVNAGRQGLSGLHFAGLCVLGRNDPFPPTSGGFRAADLRRHLAALSARNPDAISQGAVSYQLRRLRLHGLIERLPHSFRYRVTAFGFRTALFFTQLYNRLLRPGLAAAIPGFGLSTPRSNSAFDKIDAQVSARINEALDMPYSNVVSWHGGAAATQCVDGRGRFGEWAYLWSKQVSGRQPILALVEDGQT